MGPLVLMERMRQHAWAWRERLPRAARRDGLLGAGALATFFLLPSPAAFGPSAWLTGWTLLAGLALLGIAGQWGRGPATGATWLGTALLLLELILCAPHPFPARWAAWTVLPPRAWLAGGYAAGLGLMLATGFWGLGRLAMAIVRALAA
jgi:hypothetical protein